MISCRPVCPEIVTEYGEVWMKCFENQISQLENIHLSILPHFVINPFTDEVQPGSLNQWDRPCACPLLSCYPYHDRLPPA